MLRDASGEMALPPEAEQAIELEPPLWLAVEIKKDGGCTLRYCQKVEPAADVTRLQNFSHQQTRLAIFRAVRDFFAQDGFLEVDTPIAVRCPGMEPYLDTFAVGNLYLRTSPELHMKRLLAGGFDKIFQIAPCFRAGDHGSIHREEFQLLEWYRAFADLNHLIDDVGRMLHHLSNYAEDPDYFKRRPQVIDCETLFREQLDIQLVDHEDREPLRAGLDRFGLNYEENDDWDTLYFRLFLNLIEAKLGFDAPLILQHYPASQAALAKKAPLQAGHMPFCYRFELYIRGIELANAFYELTDAAEQRTRFEADRRLRGELGKPVYDLDEAFLAALEGGMPPSAGIALGMDRLVMALLGKTRLDEILPFPEAD